ncbi:flagellar hook protein FlgE [Aliihoeflea sp. 40Bstr573]|uniref:flagellar hook protein FlgE n=1 Tax=Aliihoeflea sp. 40Bstr573 TaxID=2696467 RepID=UPI002095E050|nr:flagellar hook protein FlgE [Aliihoeflea sp. 40Bstr573]MCO6386593.1 flagellar hook-basal body complex protein [Aliihoeflea sp. 40Bstr573]
MSLYGMMRTGVSGMNAQSNRLGTVADNIANSGTMGYKRAYTEFSALILPGENGSYSSGAVKTTVRNSIADQGLLQFTSSTTDIAIQGDGFFLVQNGAGDQFMTRAGSFVPDAQGRLVNAAGFYLLGTTNMAAGLTPDDLEVISISSTGLTASPSTEGAFSPNLPALANEVPAGSRASDNVAGAQFSGKTSMTVYTGLGEERIIDLYFTKVGPSEWEVAAYDASTADATTRGFPYTSGPLNDVTQTIGFSTVDGALLDPANANVEFTIPNGGLFKLSLAGTQSLAADYTARAPAVNGSGTGGFDEISIDLNGMVSALNKNGSVINLFRIPIATVTSPDRLTTLPGNVYQSNNGSGGMTIGVATTSNFGEIVSGALEGSNVDIAEELTSMIESQRNYTANSKVFQTGADLLDVLVNLKR